MKRLQAVLWFLCPVLLAPGIALARPVVSAAQLAGDADHPTLELTLTAAPDYQVFYLASPYRLVVDMEALDWRAASPAKARGASLISGLRYGLQKSGTSRLVLD